MRRATRWKLIFFVLFACSALGYEVVTTGYWPCCDESFQFDEVVKVVLEKAQVHPTPYYSILVSPAGGLISKGIPSSSHESVAYAFNIGARFRTNESHAYFLKTPIGAAVHHWNVKTKEYRKRTLFGRDIFDMKFQMGRLAWIANHSNTIPNLWLVSDKQLTPEEAALFAKDVMNVLGAESAMAYVRTDPYSWPSESGWPYSLPLQWSQPIPESDSILSRQHIRCDLSLPGATAQCVLQLRR